MSSERFLRRGATALVILALAVGVASIGCSSSGSSQTKAATPAGTPAAVTPAVAAAAAPAPAPEPAKAVTVDLGGGVKMEMVLIQPGSFRMGSVDGNVNERPVHEVKITKAFYMGKYEVTQEQWIAVMGTNPSTFKGPQNPVEQMSFDDCQDFLARVSARARVRFRLPTEAEWEYACRAGTTTSYFFGDTPAALGEYAWYGAGGGDPGNSGGTSHPVGQKKPNPWGLYDINGNVWERCSDRYDEEYYAHSPSVDPQGRAWGGVSSVIRGGSWSDGDPTNFRCAYRDSLGRGRGDDNYGFRCAMSL